MIGDNILRCVSAWNDGGKYGFARVVITLNDQTKIRYDMRITGSLNVCHIW